MPAVRLALCGALTGPDVSAIVLLLGRDETVRRLIVATEKLAGG